MASIHEYTSFSVSTLQIVDFEGPSRGGEAPVPEESTLVISKEKGCTSDRVIFVTSRRFMDVATLLLLWLFKKSSWYSRSTRNRSFQTKLLNRPPSSLTLAKPSFKMESAPPKLSVLDRTSDVDEAFADCRLRVDMDPGSDDAEGVRFRRGRS